MPARVDSSDHDTATSVAPQKTAMTAEYTWIQPRSRGLPRN